MKVTHKQKPLKPGEQEIESRNCCGQCLYNVPKGTFQMFFPGIMCLVIGIIMYLTTRRNTWRKGMIQADLIFIVLGATLSAGGVIYCLLHYIRLRNRKPSKYPDEGNAVTSSSTVQLVGVYRITDEESNPQHTTQTSPDSNPKETRT